jgi:transcriptional regulator with XRE-family HTH domain
MQSPGEAIRGLRNKLGLTLSAVSERTGLAVSTLSKLEKGKVSLSYDKLMTLSAAFGVDMAQLLGPTDAPTQVTPPSASGRRAVQRAGEGYDVETQSYRQLYLATDILHKLATPLLAEVRARTLAEFVAEFGGLIHHPGEEFAYVMEGAIDFHTELYSPVRLAVGDSVYFDSGMGHAYLKAADERCLVLAVCCARSGGSHEMMEEFKSASERLVAAPAAEPVVTRAVRASAPAVDKPARRATRR